MSFQETMSRQDTVQLITLGASLSLVYSYTPLGVTNFALFLFGIVSHEMTSSNVPFRQFIGLVLFTGIFDLLRLPSLGFPSISGICGLIVMLLKIPIYFSCVAKLQERGADFQVGVPNWQSVQNIRQNFSMPQGRGPATGGGVTTFGAQAPPPPPGAFPSSGGFRLGGDDDDNSGQGHQAQAPAPGRNGYSSIA